VIVNACVYGIFYNYLKACLTDPGGVPSTWLPPHIANYKFIPSEDDINSESDENMERIEEQKIHYCWKCSAYKPPRAHHCSDCQRCVLKMDHHCPWVNNCVGAFNHKFFLSYLVLLNLEGLHMIVLFVARLIDAFSIANIDDENFAIGTLEGFLIAMQLIILIPTLLGVICLLVYQLQLIADNTTNIESFEKEIGTKRAKKQGRKYHFPYDRGCFQNFRSVFGSKMYMWFLPSFIETDGINFPHYKSVDV